ncbi:MAG: efflux RND transporter periplasmic adaptor subunit [Deltaproteobacteria bacterium HGW-Deltaproteobacteria-8]|jgi:multidrug efflux system membrane fusion protein|nr:MAG: efflux RND transporter periplasmic adaptor subunit [Deltaproteobacteria bacterium HGW-Deltaproteobacteria-8]
MIQCAPPAASLVHNSSQKALALILTALLLALAACGKGDDKGSKAKRPVAVSVAEATAMNVPVLVLAVGNVEAYASVVIKPQVSGIIAKQLVRDGQDVQIGTPLFLIDQRTYQASLQEAQARLQKDQAQSQKAEDDLRRFKELFDQGAVSREQLEQIQANTIGLRASLALDRAQVEQARLQLGFASITSPIAGRAGHVLVQEGNLVGKSSDDRALVIINQIQPIFVSFSVPERHLPEIQKQYALGQLRVEAQTAEGVVLDTGRLASIDNAVDKTTGTIRLKAVFDNKGKNLWPGQFVRAFLRLAERENAVVIPAQAVQTGVSGPFVFVVKADNTVEMRAVTVSPAPDQSMVADTGVAPGEKVVVDGQVMLVPGSAVEIKTAKDAPKAKEAAPAAQANASAPHANAPAAAAPPTQKPPAHFAGNATKNAGN